MKLPKQLPILAAALLMSGTATFAAQDEMTATIEADLSDATARTGSPRDDVNGDRCALIRLELEKGWSKDDFTFEACGSMGVTETLPKSREIWIYLPNGTRCITIMHKHFGKLHNFDLVQENGKGLQGGVVYLMKLKVAEEVELVKKPSLKQNYLRLICYTEGASLSLDGGDPEPFNKNGIWSTSLPYGKHKISVKAGKWYKPYLADIDITEGERVEKTVTLEPEFAKLTINTEPAGATIYINDEPQEGETPIVIEKQMKGMLKISTAKELYKTTTETVEVVAGVDKVATITLQPNFANITLVAGTSEATISVDGQSVGATQWSGKLKAGEHVVEMAKESHRSPGQISITVTAGKDETITLPKLTPIYGILKVEETNGVDAEIFFGDNSTKATTPHIFRNLLVGEYNVSLKAKGYKRASKAVTVTESKVATVKLTLQEEDKEALLRIRANVAASVSINGKAVQNGITPCNVKIPIPQGQMQATIGFTAPGYDPVSKTVTLESGDNDIYAELNKIQQATITVSSNVEATVEALEKTGTTPFTLPTVEFSGSRNTLSVTVSAEGYETKTETVTLKPGANSVFVPLREVPSGTLRIRANTSARVEIDGKYEGYTPTTAYKVPLGRHIVSFWADDHKSVTEYVYVQEGNNEVTGYLKPLPLTTFFADYQMSMTSMYGASLGLCKRFGGYLTYKSGSFMYTTPGELKTMASKVNVGALSKDAFKDFEKQHYRQAFTAGGMFRIAKFLYAYAGLGFGQYGLVYDMNTHDNGETLGSYYSPQLIEGLEWEAGAKLKLSFLTANLGYSAITGSKFGELHFGAGLAFDKVTTAGFMEGMERFMEEFMEGFTGSYDRHDAFGRFHLRTGYGLCNVKADAVDLWEGMVFGDFQYNNSKLFGINGELGLGLSSSVALFYTGLYSNYFIGDHFAFEYGLGYMAGKGEAVGVSAPYLKLGASVMFDGEMWGGFNYSYMQGLGSGPKISTHNLTYTVGQFPTIVIGTVTVTVGLIALLAVLAAEAEPSTEPYYY
ncbi:MAG: PEGA domain-containing protein [Prevotellaceae bacterium]|jgi:hypothetical protein|nr:PEGA domain-containing protein [Prevotellaceae bacterium]